MRTLERRVSELEAGAASVGALRANVLHRPDDQATESERASYAERLAAARKAGGPLILLKLNRQLAPAA